MSFLVEIPDAVSKLSKRTTFMQPIYECICNSLEANAKNIEVIFQSDKSSHVFENENAEEVHKVNSYSITDDGEGFNEDNRKSFSQLWTTHKLHLGCKGYGRLTWLHIFKDITIRSSLMNEEVIINYSMQFKPHKNIKVQKEDNQSSENKTIISFDNLTDKILKIPHKTTDRRIDKRPRADLDALVEDILNHLLIKLQLLKQNNVRFNITLKLDDKEQQISDTTLPDLQHRLFKIYDNSNTEHKFNLYYKFNQTDNKPTQYQYYCANGRAVEKFKGDASFKALHGGYSSVILLSSEYFDSRVNDERNEFTFKEEENEDDLFNPLSFSKINDELKLHLNKIIQENIQDTEKANTDVIHECIQEYPYLAKYIKEDRALVKSKDDIIKAANRSFIRDKEKAKKGLNDALQRNNVDVSSLQQAVENVSDISARELGEYVLHRELIIHALNVLNIEKEKQESIFHNLIMQKQTEDTQRTLYSNNIWLLDDKFMNYAYIGSDKTVKQIKEIMGVESASTDGHRNRPDLFAFFSKPEGIEQNNAIIVELKAINASKDEKTKSITEIANNAGNIRDTFPSIGTMWNYIITDIDDDLMTTLERNDFTKLFTNEEEGKMFYRYIKHSNTHTYALSLDAILKDAGARNSVFLEMIKQQ